MKRTKGIIAAGSFTGLVLITILALGSGNLRADGGTTELPTPQTGALSSEEALQAWQAYSSELEQTVRTMQDRETAYQEQLRTANDTITQLQEEINGGNSSGGRYEDDDDRYEDDDEEHEHKAHEWGEDDDD